MSEKDKITITDGDKMFSLKQTECIDLELKLNITKYGHAWSYIGDYLYNSVNKKDKIKSNVCQVTQFQLKYLNKLRQTSYDDVVKMTNSQDNKDNPQ